MRRRSALLLVVACCLVLAGCPTDGGNRSALSSTTTRPRGATTTTQPGAGPAPTAPGGTAPGGGTMPGLDGEAPPQDPRGAEGVPPEVVIGGAKLQWVATGSGQTVDIERPSLGNGLQVVGLLERAQGLVVVVRGPLPQDPGAVWVLGDDRHQPRSLGTGLSVVAGPTDHELWVAAPTGEDGVTPVRRVDTAQEVPALSQRVPPRRVLAGYGAGGLLLGTAPDEEGDANGPVDVMDPTRGTLVRRLADRGYVIAADGQRAVVLGDGSCVRVCTVRVTTEAADRPFTLPAGLVPEPGGATSAGFTVFIGRSADGPRHVWVLSHTTGTATDSGLALPPEAGAAPMAMDPQGSWTFLRSGPSTLVAVEHESASAQALPWPLDPWSHIAVSNGGVCPCRQPTGGSGEPVI